MGTTADKLATLLQTKANIKSAIIEKGQDVPDNLPFSGYANKIRSIESGNPTTLGMLPPGSIIWLNENRSPVPFWVCTHDYESQLNGPGRTLVLRMYIEYAGNDFEGNFNDYTNEYADGTMDTWFNTAYKNMLDSDIQTLIGETSFYYTVGGSTDNSNVAVLQRSVFTPSVTEYGFNDAGFNVEGTPFPLPDFLIYPVTASDNFYKNNLYIVWTRSAASDSKSYAGAIRSTRDKSCITKKYNVSNYYRPCFTLPSDYVPFT